MRREFDLRNPSSVAELAITIQSKVYWDSYFYLAGTEERVQYKDFWEICQYHIESNDCSRVVIEENSIEEVRFS